MAESVCKTPGAVWHSRVSPGQLRIERNLNGSPFAMSESKAMEVERRMHDALETVIAQLIDELYG